MKLISKTITMQVPERFKDANPVDIVFEVEHENISSTGFKERDWNRTRNKSLLNKLKTSMKKNSTFLKKEKTHLATAPSSNMTNMLY